MAMRAQSWLVEPIPGYQGLTGGASLIDFPALPTDRGTLPVRKTVAASRRATRPAKVASDLQNALYVAGMSLGLVIGTTLGLGVLGMAGF
jgi:hypothetical protein